MLELKFDIYYRAASHLTGFLCLSWSLPPITEQQVSPHRFPMEYWLENHWPDQAFFEHSPHTNSISNSAIFCNNYISLLKVQWFKGSSISSNMEHEIHNACIQQQTGKEMQHMQTQIKTLEIRRCTAATCGCYVGEGTQMICGVWTEKLRHGHLRPIGIWIAPFPWNQKTWGSIRHSPPGSYTNWTL